MDKQDGRAAGEAGDVQLDDPWYEGFDPGWGENDAATGPTGGSSRTPANPPLPKPRSADHGDVYLAVRRSAAFREVRRRYRRFVVPATALFLTWYLAYVIAATTAPHLMAHRVVGALNVAMFAGLGQFATTFLLTWAYARHARLRRDSAALDIRWETQELTGRNLR